MIRRWLPLLLIAVGALRVSSTWRVFTQTYDEAFHLACGLEWWQARNYGREPMHPPLARIAIGALPYLVESRTHNADPNPNGSGNTARGHGENYVRGLAAARAGILPFFLIFCVSLWRWTVFRASPEAGLAAVFIASQLPPVLGHSGLATTDMAQASLLALFGWRFDVWLRSSSWRTALLAGLALGLALVAKFTVLVFAPTIALVLWLFHRKFEFSQSLLLVGAALIPISLCYPSPSTVDPPADGSTVSLPGFIEGVRQASQFAGEGQTTFLLGRAGTGGDWRFFPVAFFFKTPIPILVLLLVALLRREARWAWCLGAVFMALLLPSNVNLGIRHALPVYAGVTIAGGIALASLWRGGRWAAVALAAWLAWNSASAHPDYAFWFNEFAGKHPERILAESDIDWGQDLHRAVAALDRRGIAKCRLAYFGANDPHVLFPGRFEDFWWPAEEPGCTLVSVRNLSLERAIARQAGLRDELAWLDKYEPAETIGQSMRLYLIDKVH